MWSFTSLLLWACASSSSSPYIPSKPTSRRRKSVLEAVRAKRRSVLLASTSEVYGKLDKPHFNEEDDVVLGPTSRSRWCYAASKIIDEFLAKPILRKGSCPPSSCACSTLSARDRQGSTAWWYRASSDRRCWASRSRYTATAANGARSHGWPTCRRQVKLIQHPQAYGDMFNIGHTDEITIYELAALVKRMTESPSEIVCIPYEQAYEAGFEDMARRLPDLTKIQDLIGYRPTLDLPRMLEWIIAYERLELLQRAGVERPGISRRAASAAPTR